MCSPVMAQEGSGIGRHYHHIQYQSPRGSRSRVYRRTLQTSAERLDVEVEIDMMIRTVHNLVTSITLWANPARTIVGPSAFTCSPSRQRYIQGGATYKCTFGPNDSSSTL